ncbi:hypothetical protein L1987_42854 [Smallanthus sonchifolius]|uniref:Uncharacterized protein n=1 Tax=Smallanthus sonchifolius TaxID=185202 RepID=A0ACB9GL38_9ASTR|nr:hypothetical protein L1987_42854 [Smallanthus sonchifolius]
MMKFASFETIVEMMHKHAIPTPKEQCRQSFQLGVSFAGGYLAGILCTVVSHPPDNLVSFLNNSQEQAARVESKAKYTRAEGWVYGYAINGHESFIRSF